MNVKKLYLQAYAKFKAKKFDEALELLDEINRLEPNSKKVCFLEAFILYSSDEYLKAVDKLKKLLPRYDLSASAEKEAATLTLNLLATIYEILGVPEETLKLLKLSAQMTSDDARGLRICSESILTANRLETFAAEDFQALYDEYKKYLADITPYPKKFYDHKRIRIGFLSSGFCEHVAINWSLSLLTELDKNLFKVCCYSNTTTRDDITDCLIGSVEHWRDISGLTDEAAAKLIRDDEIDILFDLNGHTDGNRLRVAAYRPAAVQMSGIGYMSSTGLECFDYFLSDIYCAGDETYFTEKLIKLPHSHICYEPPTKLEPASAPPCLKNNFVTFGCFNYSGKITDTILITWKKILDAVPGSRLLLKNKLLNTDDGKNFFCDKLKSLGFDINRVEMRPFSDTWLNEYDDVDIALDTFPYTGGVTTCEALYMGVPVVSLYGNRHGSRFGLSILENVGLDKLAVDSYDEYINRAVILADDWALLAFLKKNLRMMMKNSPLMDSPGYVREVEDTFIKILNDERSVADEHKKTLFRGE